MTQDLRTTPEDVTMAVSATNVTAAMGLRHRLSEYVSQEEGDGKPTSYSIAKQAGISTNTIYRIKSSPDQSMSWEIIGKLCAALEIQPGDLLYYEES